MNENEIDMYGSGLGIMIACRPLPIDHWMAFASWYSTRKNLPDAKVVIACTREKQNKPILGWAYRCRVALAHHSVDVDPHVLANSVFCGSRKRIVISPYVHAIRGYVGADVVPVNGDLSTDEPTTFVDCKGGCGGFVFEEWVDKWQPPFGKDALKFKEGEVTANELQVLKLWAECESLYLATQ